ncbi:MAG: ABC transporter ATP-binding protein [Deltaproteobacteria bacterium]|nr:ABC transporter ATP-binding protein [Deltaproteobacteria bacterium]
MADAPPTPPWSTEAPLLEVEELTVDYVTPTGRVRAVDRVSFTVARGEIVGLAGESGSGKSTVVHALMRTLGPPAVIAGGSVRYQGRDVLAMDEAALRRFRWREMALVFQSAMDALNPVLTIGEQLVDTIRAHAPTSRRDARARARDLLALVGIDPGRLDSHPHTLSGGMRQRVAIAIALALEPPLLLMDEPTTALDVVVEKEILQKLLELKDRLGFSVLVISHDLPLLLELTDRLGVLYAGRLAELGPSAALRAGSRHPYTRGLMRAFPSLTGPRQALVGIPGSPPSLASPPTGCPFHPRCELTMPTCRAVAPALSARGPDHLAACHATEVDVGRQGAAREA